MADTKGTVFTSAADIRNLELAVKYYSILRKVLALDNITQGTQPIYDMDPNAYAYMVPYQASSPIRMMADEEARVWVRTFNLIAYKEFPRSDEFIRGTQYTNRVKENLRSALNELEDELLFRVFARVIADGSYPYVPIALGSAGPPPVYGQIGYDDMQTATGAIEQYTNLGHIIGRASAIDPMRIWGESIFSPERREEILKTGQVGVAWGADVLKTRKCPAHELFVTCTAENLGRVPQVTSLQSMENQRTKDVKVEISVFENIGVCIFNPWGIFQFTYTT